MRLQLKYYPCIHTILRAHAAASKAIRAINPKAKIGIALYQDWPEPLSNSPDDIVRRLLKSSPLSHPSIGEAYFHAGLRYDLLLLFIFRLCCNVTLILQETPMFQGVSCGSTLHLLGCRSLDEQLTYSLKLRISYSEHTRSRYLDLLILKSIHCPEHTQIV